MTDVDPEKATIGDLFRLMTELRADSAKQAEWREGVSAKLEKIEGKLEGHTGELQAIRTVVDTLPSYEMVESIETAQNRMAEDIATARSAQHQATTFQRQTVSRLDRLEAGQDKVAKGLDRAGIAVR